MQSSAALTKYPSGSIREFGSLTASFALVLFFTTLMGFVDRILLGRYSLESLQACVSAVSLSSIFQMFCTRISYLTQTFIGQHQGANRSELMGPTVWQSIWFSFLSMGIVLPVGWMIGPKFFAGTEIAQLGLGYFQILLLGNFLFPLGAALVSFYLGRGLIKIVLAAACGAFVLNIALDLGLIFGIPGVFPPLGSMGSALAAILAQMGLCLFLFADFLKRKNRETYGTGQWKFNGKALIYTLKIGIPRSLSSVITLGAWAAVTQIMMRKGGDYMNAMVLGSGVFLITNGLAVGLAQAASSAGAYAIGAKSRSLLWKVYQSGCLLSILLAGLLAVPCVFFPELPIALFFSEEISPSLRASLQMSCGWISMHVLGQWLLSVGNGMLIASHDTLFHLLVNLTFGWMVSYFPVYICIQLWGWPPHTFFICTAGLCFMMSAVFYFRFSQGRWEALELV